MALEDVRWNVGELQLLLASVDNDKEFLTDILSSKASPESECPSLGEDAMLMTSSVSLAGMEVLSWIGGAGGGVGLR